MHEDSTERFPGRLQVRPGQDPDTILINGRGQFRDPQTGLMTNTPLEVFTVTPGRRYRFRMINAFCTVCPAQLTIEGHPLLILSSDGEPVQPMPVNTIISFTGERYDFVINADQPIGAYHIQASEIYFNWQKRRVFQEVQWIFFKLIMFNLFGFKDPISFCNLYLGFFFINLAEKR